MEVPTSNSGGASRSPLAWVVVLATFGLLAGTGLLDSLRPVPRPWLKGAERAADERMRREASFRDGSWARLKEYDHRLTSRVRRALAAPYAGFLYRYLREVDPSVHVGEDGWLFLAARATWPADAGDLPIRRAAVLETALTLRAQSLGMRLAWMHIPRKAAIEADALPRGLRAGVEFESQIVPEMRRHGLEAIDLFGIPEGFKRMEPEPAYRKTDSHWSSYGRARAALETARQLDLLRQEDRRRGEMVVQENRGRSGALLAMIGVRAGAAEEALEPATRLGVRVDGDGLRGGDATAPVAVAGTSFTTASLGEMLSHYMDRDVQVVRNDGGSPYAALWRVAKTRWGAPNGEEAGEVNWPELLIADVPNHFVMQSGVAAARSGRASWVVQRDAARWLAKFPPTGAKPLRGAPSPLAQRLALEVPFAGEGNRVLAVWSEGAVAHTGDGSLSLELDVTLDAPGGRLALLSDGTKLIVPMGAGRHRLILPVLATTPSAPSGRLLLESPSGHSGTVHHCRWVTGPARESAPFGAASVERGRVRQRADWTGALLPRYTICAVEMEADNAKRLREVRVTFRSNAADLEQVFEFPELDASAPLVLNPGLFQGQALDSVEVEWRKTGPPAAAPEHRALNLRLLGW